MSSLRSEDGMSPPAELEARIRASIASAPAPAMPAMKVRARVVVAVVVLVLGATLAVVVAHARDLAAYPLALAVTTTSVASLLALLGVFAAASPGRRGLGAPITALIAVAVGVPILYAATMAIAPMEPMAAPAANANHGALTCFLLSVGIAGVGLVALVYALRRSVPVAPFARGAALGAAAGAWAGLAVHLHCPAFDRMHILLGHVAPIVIFALLGGVLARRIIRP